jgi:hypothetical protein
MAVDLELDVQLLKSEIKKTYASVSLEPDKDFIFPTGRAWVRSTSATHPTCSRAFRMPPWNRSPTWPIPSRSAGSNRASGCAADAYDS